MKKLSLFLLMLAIPFLALAAIEVYKDITFRITSTDVDSSGAPTMYHLSLMEVKKFSDGAVRTNSYQLNVPPSTIATQGINSAIKSAYLTQVPIPTVQILLTPTPNEQ